MRTRFEGLFKILKLMFRQDFEAEVWLLFCCWCLVLAIKFIVGRDSGLVLSKWWCLVEILKLMQGRDSEDVWSRFAFELVIWPKEVTLVSRTQCFFRNGGLLLSTYGTFLTLLIKLTRSSMMMLLAKTAMEHKEDDFAVLLTNNWPPWRADHRLHDWQWPAWVERGAWLIIGNGQNTLRRHF